jgi:hypothetical protein
MAQLPEIPTVAEQGFPGYEVRSWWGIVAPAGVPAPILQKLHAGLSAALSQAEARNRLEQLGATVHASSPCRIQELHCAGNGALGKSRAGQQNLRDRVTGAATAPADCIRPSAASDFVHLHFGARAGWQLGRRFGRGEIELELGADRVVQKYLVAGLRDVLLFEIHARLFSAACETRPAPVALNAMWSTLPLCLSTTIEPAGKRPLTCTIGSSPSYSHSPLNGKLGRGPAVRPSTSP